MMKMKLANTVLVLVLLLLAVITAPLTIIPKYRYTVYWKYLWTHRCLVFRIGSHTDPKVRETYDSVLGLSIAAYGISMVGLSPAANIGLLYHELGHIVDPKAFSFKGRNAHLDTIPDDAEVAADRYAVRNGYGQELFDALEPYTDTCPDIAQRLQLIRQAMDKLNDK